MAKPDGNMRRGTKFLIASNAVANMGWGLCWAYLNFRLYDIGATYLQICLLDSLGAVAALLSRAWGALSDYYGRRKPFMLAGLTASAFPVAFMAAFNDNVWGLLLSYFTAYFIWAVGYPAFMAAITSDPEREKATTALALVGSLGWASGAVLMGPAERHLGPGGVFLACLAILLVLPAFLLPYEEERLPCKAGSPLSYMASAFSFKFKAEKGFGFLLAGMCLSWLGLQWSSPLARMRLYDALGHSKGITGVVWALSSITSALALLAAKRGVEKIGGIRTLALAVACYAIFMPSYALVDDPTALVVLWLLPIWPFFNLGCMLGPAELSEEEFRGEAMGAGEVAKNSGLLAGMLGGLVADTIGREESLVLSAVPLLSALAFTVACLRVSRVNRFRGRAGRS